jgi:hypothetical protein
MNQVSTIPFRRTLAVLVAAMSLSWAAGAQAHCDTLDGPVVGAARQALDAGNVNLVLGWVQKKDEAEVRNAFQKATAVRKTSAAAKDLADTYFFETLVRVHRAGEGAPYTGLKPAGKIEPAIALADKSIETGKLEPVANALTERMHQGLHKQFQTVVSKKNYKPGDVAATRAYVQAYVPYVHYVERLHDAAGTGGAAHAQEQAKPAGAAAHAH